jgi:SAM-dependent methyltransferase
VWAVGAAYEPYVGRWSRQVAAAFLGWLAVPPGSRWLDVGCGTGAVTSAVLAGAAPARVVGVDPSAGFVGYAAARVAAGPAVGFAVGDARALPLRDRAVDAVVSGLMLNFVPEPSRAIAEMVRVCDGVVAAYVWDYAEGMGFMRAFWDAAAAVDPAAPDEGPRFPLCRPEPLGAAFADAGLADVEVEAVEIPTRFRDFDDFWDPFLGGQGAAPAYAMSLSEPHRDALRERLRAGLPYGPDGAIDLTARAWAVRGHRR